MLPRTNFAHMCGTTDKLVDYPTDCDDGSTMVVLDNGEGN